MLPLRFVTLSGVPIEITQLRWPFHQSTSGSDWFVLHGRVDLLDAADTEKLHAEVAVAMTQTMKEALGSLEPPVVEGMVVNAIRKTIDNGQLAFLKSGKLQPVHVTSRFYSFLGKTIQFPTQSEDAVREMLRRRVYWLGRQGTTVEIAHAYDCQYVNFSRDQMLATAQQLAVQGWVRLEDDRATATPALLQDAPSIIAAMNAGVEACKAATKVTA